MNTLPAIQENICTEFVFYFWTYIKKPLTETPEWPWRIHSATFEIESRPTKEYKRAKSYPLFSAEKSFRLAQEVPVFSSGEALEKIYRTITKEEDIPIRYKPIIKREHKSYSRYYWYFFKKDEVDDVALFSMRMPYQVLSILEQKYPEKKEAIHLLKEFSAKTGITFDKAVENLYLKISVPLLRGEGR
jgi:hypothetical protein